MRAGTLRYICKILRPSQEENTWGENDFTYKEISTPRCDIKNTGGNKSETINGSETIIPYTKTFTFRYHIDIKDNDIIEYDFNRYRILNINKENMSRSIIVSTEKINN